MKRRNEMRGKGSGGKGGGVEGERETETGELHDGMNAFALSLPLSSRFQQPCGFHFLVPERWIFSYIERGVSFCLQFFGDIPLAVVSQIVTLSVCTVLITRTTLVSFHLAPPIVTSSSAPCWSVFSLQLCPCDVRLCDMTSTH